MSTGGNEERQGGVKDASGGNIVGKNPAPPKLYQPADFQGKSGTPDNQTTDRGKGRT